jgi:imidazolonepropionase-like amidohydrolase
MAAPRPKRSRFRSRFTASACEIRTCPQNEIHHWDRRELSVKSGLTPLEALQTATIRPAEYFGIAEGKLADLVLLNADPLKDIANTQKIDSVVAAGRYFTRDDLDKSLMRH